MRPDEWATTVLERWNRNARLVNAYKDGVAEVDDEHAEMRKAKDRMADAKSRELELRKEFGG